MGAVAALGSMRSKANKLDCGMNGRRFFPNKGFAVEMQNNVFLGLGKEEAVRRAEGMGAAFFFVEYYGKKGPVEGADCTRVIRAREVNGEWELILSSFCCSP